MAITILPNAGQSLDVTRDPVRINFQTIDTGLQVDHVQLDLAAPNSGKHKAVHLVNQAPAPVTLANEGALYAAIGAISGETELSFRRESNGDIIPFTEADYATPGWTWLPSGMMIKWGTDSSGTNPFKNIPFVAPFFPNACLSVQVTITMLSPGAENRNWFSIGGFATNQFVLLRGADWGGSFDFCYLAIGY